MGFKFINATEVRAGTAIIINDKPCIVKNIDISKTGKHGHAKVRIEAVGIIDGQKRILVKPGTDRFEVPHIEKRRGQILSISGDKASMMDIESFETIDIELPKDGELREEIKEGVQVEYWIVEGTKIIKRKV